MSTRVKFIIRSLIPEKIYIYLAEQHYKLIFYFTMKKVLNDPILMLSRKETISKLNYGWGNIGWSAPDEYLMNIIEYAKTMKSPILECGSGLSTLLLGIIAEQTGSSIWTLEHNNFWGNRTRKYLKKYKLKSVNLYINELTNYDDYTWYNPPLNEFPKKFGLVVCDGPPSDTYGGRYGLIPIMKERLASGCLIFLDDFDRLEEREIVEKWMKQLNAKFLENCQNSRYSVIKISQPIN